MRYPRLTLHIFIAAVLTAVPFRPLQAQDIGISTSAIESLIKEWNFANNTRNEQSFQNVYADELLFYTQQVSSKKAIELKKQLFELKPYFRQRITTPVTYTPYTSGLIKCDFVKEVFERTRWKKYPSYLLVSYENQRYWIVGESDNSTDRVLKYALDIGEPMTFTPLAENASQDTAISDSIPVAMAPMKVVDSLKALLERTQVSRMFSDASSFGVVQVPIGYIYILIGLLSIGGLMIFLADRTRSRNKSLPEKGAALTRHEEAEQVVKDFKMQSVFEAFVITLFDPLYFRYRRPKSEPVFAGKGPGIETVPDLLFEYENKETHLSFGIKCQYYKHMARNEVQLFDSDQINLVMQFEEHGDMHLYYVLGFGGTPDDPKELFFVPMKAVKNEYISKAALRQFSKSGMFYYNRSAGQIQ